MPSSTQKKNPSDQAWMELACLEALRAKGQTSPNPIVGAVLVRGGKLLAKGYHHRAGLPHAEIEALKQVKDPKGATLFVTLEPCCHSGKRTPPCTDAILKSGIKRVVVGTLDPNPLVSGKGVRLLRKAGIAVEVGVLAEDCANLNPYYNRWMQDRRPYVIAKIASSLDGKIALANGKSRWISHEASRQRVHEMRGEVDAILVGIGTVVADDPELNVRLAGSPRQAIKIILDPQLKISPKAKVFRSSQAPLWIVTKASALSGKKAKTLQAAGAELLSVPTLGQNRLDLKKFVRLLGEKGVQSLVVEGGPGVWTEFFQQKCLDELQVFLAPKLLGGDAKPILRGLGLRKLPDKIEWHLAAVQILGPDLHLTYRKS